MVWEWEWEWDWSGLGMGVVWELDWSGMRVGMRLVWSGNESGTESGLGMGCMYMWVQQQRWVWGGRSIDNLLAAGLHGPTCQQSKVLEDWQLGNKPLCPTKQSSRELTAWQWHYCSYKGKNYHRHWVQLATKPKLTITDTASLHSCS